MKPHHWFVVAASLLCLGATAQAAEKEKWETRSVADKPQIVLDPAKAYVVVQSDYMITPMLMRVANADEAAKHAADRAEEFAKERAKWAKRHAEWERTMASFAKQPASVSRPKEPQEPTESNFPWPRYEQVHSVIIGPQNRFAKGEGGASTYLQEVKPGEYLFYGNTMGIGGICACLGTVAFKAEAGKVTSLGKLKLALADMSKLPKEQRPKNSLALPEGLTTMAFEPAPFADPRVAADLVSPAQFRPVDRMPNWFGLEVDRLTAIDGMMRYERDKLIDLSASAAGVAASR